MLWEAVAATTAAPALLKPVQINGDTFIDGGVVANDPRDARRLSFDLGTLHRAGNVYALAQDHSGSERVRGGVAGASVQRICKEFR